MVCIAITGGLASGKSTMSAYLRHRFGIAVLDADDVVSSLYRHDTKIIDDLVTYFGTRILKVHGGIDTKLLADLIFSSDRHRDFVQSVVHPVVRDRLRLFSKQHTHQYVFCVVPLLYETNTAEHYEATLVVDCDSAQQRERALQRGMREDIVSRIMAMQSTRAQKLSIADDVVYNTRDVAFLYRQMDKLFITHRRRGLIVSNAFGKF